MLDVISQTRASFGPGRAPKLPDEKGAIRIMRLRLRENRDLALY